MVAVGVSRMGKTGIVFVEPGAKVNSEYYCQHVLGGGLLPDIRARCQRGVPRRQPHRRSGLATLPSVGAFP